MFRNLFLLLYITLLAGCRQYAYYMSPFQSNDHPYRTLPRLNSPMSSATYVSGSLSTGFSNQGIQDEVVNLQTSIYRGSHFSAFQAYYGANLSMGIYGVNKYDSSPLLRPRIDAATINRYAGNKFFGGIGVIGGIDVVVRLGGGEWRVLQLETTIQQEFGAYLRFRNELPDATASAISHVNPYATISIGTDIIGTLKRRNAFGYKFALVTATRALYGDFGDYPRSYVTPFYASNIFHLTIDPVTVYFQSNIGTQAWSFQTGINAEISRNRKNNRRLN